MYIHMYIENDILLILLIKEHIKEIRPKGCIDREKSQYNLKIFKRIQYKR
jgi:hypothetical protein